MDVSAISSSTSNTYVSSNTSAISQLESKRTTLQKELLKISQSSDDAKTKEEKTKLIQTQIQQIDLQIQQKKAESNNTSQPVSNEQKPSEPIKTDEEKFLGTNVDTYV